VTYQWQDRRPEILVWARELVEHRFDNSKIAAVDGRVIQKATARKTTVQWVRLFYERAGLLRTSFNLHHTGAEDGPIEFKRADELSDDELATIAGRGGRGVAEAA